MCVCQALRGYCAVMGPALCASDICFTQNIRDTFFPPLSLSTGERWWRKRGGIHFNWNSLQLEPNKDPTSRSIRGLVRKRSHCCFASKLKFEKKEKKGEKKRK